MPRYRYKAFSDDGTIIEDVAEVPDPQSLFQLLQEKGLHLINYTSEEAKVEEVKDQKEEKAQKKRRFSLFGGVSDADISLFTRQLSALVGAGVSIVDALEVVGEQLPNPKLKEAVLEVAKDVSEGNSLTNAMRKHPKVFPELVVNLVQVGEETGELDKALMRASEYYEKMAMIKSKIKSASFYPISVMVVAVIIVTAILYFIVPTFSEIYESLGGSLPLPTQILIGMSNALRENIGLIILSIVIFSIAFKQAYSRNYRFRRFIHSKLLNLPKFGDLFMKSAMAKFGRTMATLFSSGVSIERALEVAGNVAGNLVIKEAVDSVRKDITEGMSMWSAMEKTKMFPSMVIAMVKVGEETGQLDQMLESIARFYEDEVDRTVEGLISLIEPLMIVFLGVIIGGILIGLYMPIFKMGELIR